MKTKREGKRKPCKFPDVFHETAEEKAIFAHYENNLIISVEETNVPSISRNEIDVSNLPRQLEQGSYQQQLITEEKVASLPAIGSPMRSGEKGPSDLPAPIDMGITGSSEKEPSLSQQASDLLGVTDKEDKEIIAKFLRSKKLLDSVLRCIKDQPNRRGGGKEGSSKRGPKRPIMGSRKAKKGHPLLLFNNNNNNNNDEITEITKEEFQTQLSSDRNRPCPLQADTTAENIPISVEESGHPVDSNKKRMFQDILEISAGSKASQAHQQKTTAKVHEDKRLKRPSGKSPFKANQTPNTRTKKDGCPGNDEASAVFKKS